MAILIDTNVFVALGVPHDPNHANAVFAMRELVDLRVIPVSVLPEMFYMLTVRMGYKAAANMFSRVRSGAFNIETLTTEDMARMQEIIEQYTDNMFDFVDLSIMAMSERLNITEIYTFDRRDFRVFRPKHCAYFELLP